LSEARHLQRLLTILNEVTRRPGLRPMDLAAELGVSERTLRRDLSELRRAGFDLEWEEGYQLQETLDLEGSAASPGGALPVLYEQQLTLLRGLYPELAAEVQREVETQAPELLAVLFQQALERALTRAAEPAAM
jgi:predicted DNA-binding transcriptional regulator YafY